jgi:alkylation response protein AidB-like acyl-CoA dehydrogenase
MRFAWTEEQVMLKSMLDRYVADRPGFPAPSRDANRAAWKELAELGLLGMPFAEEDGGSGGTALDVLLTMEAFGKGLLHLPYLSSIVLSGGLLRHAGTAEQREALIPRLIAGDLRMAFAFAEPESRYNPAHVATVARCAGDGFVLSGTKTAVLGGDDADMLIVSARTDGGSQDEAGISLFLVPADQVGIRPYALIDGMGAAEITFADVSVGADALLGEAGEALPVIERVLDEATAAICADAVGAMEALNAKCAGFAQTRSAFGKTLSEFQVIQHRLVDMQIAHEMAAAMALKAASQIASGVRDPARAVSACKVQVNEEAAMVAKAAVQMHGAIGITEELDIGHYFKRLYAMQLCFGNANHHLRRCIALDRRANVGN